MLDNFYEKTPPDPYQIKNSTGNWVKVDENTFKDFSVQLVLDDSAYTFPESNEYVLDQSGHKRLPATSFLLGLSTSFEKLSDTMQSLITNAATTVVPQGLLSAKAATECKERADNAASYVKK